MRAVEDAIGIKIPKNANLIRNILNATLYIHDHIVHFYQLSALDWVDVVSALDADPRETAAIQQRFRRAIRSQLSVTSAMCRTA